MRHQYEIHPMGNRVYGNEAEQKFQEKVFLNGGKLMRRGYPDFMVIKNGEIIGFVEVKPHQDKKLRAGQEVFKKFCQKHEIPFAKWSPGDDLPDFCLGHSDDDHYLEFMGIIKPEKEIIRKEKWKS